MYVSVNGLFYRLCSRINITLVVYLKYFGCDVILNNYFMFDSFLND